MLDLLGLAELFLSWRLYVGFALTAVLYGLLTLVIPDGNAQLILCVPVGIVGVVLSFYWQIKADT